MSCRVRSVVECVSAVPCSTVCSGVLFGTDAHRVSGLSSYRSYESTVHSQALGVSNAFSVFDSHFDFDSYSDAQARTASASEEQHTL